MATAKSQITKVAPESDGEVLYTVQVIQEVGIVREGNAGDEPALRAAFGMIADHFANVATSKGSHLEFKLTHPDYKFGTEHSFTVTVDDPPVTPPSEVEKWVTS